jgi:hypothetical protein
MPSCKLMEFNTHFLTRVVCPTTSFLYIFSHSFLTLILMACLFLFPKEGEEITTQVDLYSAILFFGQHSHLKLVSFRRLLCLQYLQPMKPTFIRRAMLKSKVNRVSFQIVSNLSLSTWGSVNREMASLFRFSKPSVFFFSFSKPPFFTFPFHVL